jgi:20S proteasome alpha/beta subunit
MLYGLIKMIAKRVAGYVSAFTLYSSVRPFGLCAIIGAVDVDGPRIFMIEPSGLCHVIISNSGISCHFCR